MEWMSFDRPTTIEGAHDFKVGFIIALVGAIVVLPSSLVSFFMLFSSSVPGNFHPEILGAWISILSFIGAIVNIVALYFIYEGFSKFSQAINGLSLGKIGTILYMVMIITSPVYSFIFIGVILGGTVGPDSVFFIFLFSAIIAILTFLGKVLMAIDLFHIGERGDKILITLGAIFYIFITLIGVILLFIGFHQLEEDLRSGKPFGNRFHALPPPPPPPV